MAVLPSPGSIGTPSATDVFGAQVDTDGNVAFSAEFGGSIGIQSFLTGSNSLAVEIENTLPEPIILIGFL